MNKIAKTIKAVTLILKNPYLLNMIINDEGVRRKQVIDRYSMPFGLPQIDINTLFPDFNQTVSPYCYLSGATLPIDIAILKALARKYEVKTYFEIGTWRGESAANMASIVPECFTLNLSKNDIIKMCGSESYANLHGHYSKKMSNVEHLYGNSLKFDFKPYYKKCDMVFVDGDHHYETVKKDTENVFLLLKNEKSIIVWHDYAFNPEEIRWNVLKGILDGCPADKRGTLYHISNTLCAVYLPFNIESNNMEIYNVPPHYFDVSIKTIIPYK